MVPALLNRAISYGRLMANCTFCGIFNFIFVELSSVEVLSTPVQSSVFSCIWLGATVLLRLSGKLHRPFMFLFYEFLIFHSFRLLPPPLQLHDDCSAVRMILCKCDGRQRCCTCTKSIFSMRLRTIRTSSTRYSIQRRYNNIYFVSIPNHRCRMEPSARAL